MALDANRLGQAFYNIDKEYNEIDIAPEDMEAKRLEIETRKAEAIINELKQHLQIVYSSGLTAPNGAVAGVFNHTVK